MMKRILLILGIGLPLAFGQTSKDLLRDGLFAEESEGDLKTATGKYEALLKSFENERKVAAVALFRLASVKRKQGDAKAALAHYEEFGRKFADIEPQATLVKENYLALAGKPLTSGEGSLNEEDQELAKLRKLENTSPDLILTGPDFRKSAEKGWSRAVSLLLEKGVSPDSQNALFGAVSVGNLAMTKQLLEAGANPNTKGQERSSRPPAPSLETPLRHSVRKQYWQIVELLLKHGADHSSIADALTMGELANLDLERGKYLVKIGADPNYMDSDDPASNPPLQWAVNQKNYQLISLLLKLGAQVDLAGQSRIRALHMAAILNDEKSMSLLIEAGADLNATTAALKDLPDVRNGLGKPRYYQYPHAPIDFMAIENTPFLLKQGAKPTSKSFLKAISAKNLQVVESMIKNGADPNQTGLGDYDFPLNAALEYGTPEIVEVLIRNGAQLSKALWSLLPPELRIEAARRDLYPEFSTSEKVTLVFPENMNRNELTQELDVGNDAISALLESKFPGRFDNRNSIDLTKLVDLSKLGWKIFREGKATETDFSKFPPPELSPGDVIEVTGFFKESFDQWSRDQWPTLATHPSAVIPLNLLRSQRLPFQLTIEGKDWDLLLCPDKVCFDVRTNEIPEQPIGGILKLIEDHRFPYLLGPERICKIHRENFGTFSFRETDNALDVFPLLANDRIEIITDPNNTSEGEKPGNRREASISAYLPGAPGSWRWQVNKFENNLVIGPTLLQAIADLTLGYPGILDPKSNSLTQAVSEIPPLRVLPFLDLSALKIHRLTSDGEEILPIDLHSKIAAWQKSGKDEPPFDLNLQAGDILELAVREHGNAGFTEREHDYLRAAFNVPLMFKGMGQPPTLQKLNYHQPRWVESPHGIVPAQLPNTVTTLRNSLISSYTSTYSILRNGERSQTVQGEVIYWPRSGDLVSIEGRTSSPRPLRVNVPVPASTNPTPPRPAVPQPKSSPRARYVPRPRK